MDEKRMFMGYYNEYQLINWETNRVCSDLEKKNKKRNEIAYTYRYLKPNYFFVNSHHLPIFLIWQEKQNKNSFFNFTGVFS